MKRDSPQDGHIEGSILEGDSFTETSTGKNYTLKENNSYNTIKYTNYFLKLTILLYCNGF